MQEKQSTDLFNKSSSNSISKHFFNLQHHSFWINNLEEWGCSPGLFYFQNKGGGGWYLCVRKVCATTQVDFECQSKHVWYVYEGLAPRGGWGPSPYSRANHRSEIKNKVWCFYITNKSKRHFQTQIRNAYVFRIYKMYPILSHICTITCMGSKVDTVQSQYSQDDVKGISTPHPHSS